MASKKTGPQGTTYRDRVRGLARLPRERIEPAPKNWRTHDDKQRRAMRGILSDVGIAGAELAWVPSDHARAALRAASTADAFAAWLAKYDGPVRLIDGHLRREELAQVQPVLVTDLDADEAALLLATFDPIATLAGRDDALLRELLGDVKPRAPGAVELIDELRAMLGDAPDVETSDDEDAAPDADSDPALSVEVESMRAPFPWFGGKSRAAPIIWGALGNVANYVEPFAGSLAVLLSRPGGPGKIETVNDLDAWVANFWRAVASDPEAVALAADWPVNEADLHSRHKWLLKQDAWRRKMLDDADHFDPKIAGWWVWGLCSWIASGWCATDGTPSEKLPQLGNAGTGVASASVQMPSEKLPHLITGSRGVHRESLGDSSVVGDNIRALMIKLRDRLRRVRVACGDWRRVLTPSVTTGHGMTGVLLDPPYAEGADDLYGNHDKSVSAEVRAWAIEHGRDADMRIAFCGYEGEHEAFPMGWRRVAWKAQGGYGSQENARRERIWLSPGCLAPGAA